MISHYGNNEKKARLLSLLMLTLRGTPIVYYGEEIGMHQENIPRGAQKDPLAHLRIWGIPVGKFVGRDGCRTPMQWTTSPINAGFSEDPNINPWLPISTESFEINVESQKSRNNSMLNFYKNLIQLRKKEPALMEGRIEVLPSSNRKCLIYERIQDSVILIVLLNFHRKTVKVKLPQLHVQPIFSSYYPSVPNRSQKSIKLRAYEGIIMKTR